MRKTELGLFSYIALANSLPKSNYVERKIYLLNALLAILNTSSRYQIIYFLISNKERKINGLEWWIPA